MGNLFDKASVAIAAPKSTKKNLAFQLNTTSGFQQLLPIFYHEMIPNARIKSIKRKNGAHGIFFSRANPFNCPTMQNIDYHFNQFFVPFKYVWPAWDDFETRSKHTYSDSAFVVPQVPLNKPFIVMSDFVHMFVTSANGFVSNGTSTQFDICVTDGADTPDLRYYRLTDMGVRALKLLNNLGYKLTWNDGDKHNVEILTLFCWGKMFIDWYFPNNYALDSDYNAIAQAFVYNGSLVQAGSAYNTVYYNAVLKILSLCTESFYNNSVFYNGWDRPIGPNGANSSALLGVSMEDPTNDAKYPMMISTGFEHNSPSNNNYYPSNGTPFIAGKGGGTSNSSGVVTHFMNQALEKITNLVKRYQLVGHRNVDHFLAMFGIKLQDPHRSYRLNSKDLSMAIGDVESTADTVNSGVSTYVGDLAGKGVCGTSLDFDYKNGSMSGLYFIAASLVTDNYLTQGVDRNRFRVTRNQHYSPEFDNLGPEAVSPAEVAMFNDGRYNDGLDNVFCYLPRGYSYISPKAIVSGAFVVPSAGASELLGYTGYRIIPEVSQATIVHDLDFMRPNANDHLLQNRCFYSVASQEQFIVKFDVQFNEWSPKLPLSQSYDFGEDEDNGMITVQAQGSQIN